MADYKQHSENELMQLLAQDDERAFNELYTRLWRTLYAVAYGHLKDISTCEDVVHDVFASLWVNRHKIEARDIKNYMAVSVRYAMLDKLRKLQRMRQVELREHDAPVENAGPTEFLDYKILLELMRDNVEKLPEKCRLIFQYSREEGKTVKEIAKELDLSPHTVRNQLVKALKNLKDGLKVTIWFW